MQIDQLNKKIIDNLCKLLASKAARYTQIVVIFVIAFLIILDVYLFVNNKPTVSQTIHFNAKNELFVITWIWGILATHLFVCREKDSQTVPELVGILVLLLISVVIFLLGMFIKIPLPQYMHVVFLGIGGVSGFYLWPQKLN